MGVTDDTPATVTLPNDILYFLGYVAGLGAFALIRFHSQTLQAGRK